MQMMPYAITDYAGNFLVSHRARLALIRDECSMLCVPYALPAYLRETLKRDGIVLETDFSHDPAAPRSLGVNRRIFFENGLELRFIPTRDRLLVELHYHHHPWLRPEAGCATDLLKSLSLHWSDILDVSLSAHQRIKWIGSLPAEPNPLHDAICHDATGRDLMQVGDSPVNCIVHRPPGVGLYVSFAPDGGSLYPKDMAPGACATALRDALIACAAATDNRIRALPLWRRMALLMATRISTISEVLLEPITRPLKRRLSPKRI